MSKKEWATSLARMGITIRKEADGTPMCLVATCQEESLHHVEMTLLKQGIGYFWASSRGYYRVYAMIADFKRAADILTSLAKRTHLEAVWDWKAGVYIHATPDRDRA